MATRSDRPRERTASRGLYSTAVADGLYLGKAFEPKGRIARRSRSVLDPSDLLTHGLIVGMTGSGKTGAAIALIEEALRQGVPVIAIDPKGDLGNLLLLFDDLSPASFEPWIDVEAARREGNDAEGGRRGRGRGLDEGPGRVGPGAGRHQGPARGARGHHLHARLRRRRRAQRAAVARRARRSRSTPPRRTCATRSRRSWAACSACSRSTPTRCSRASTSSSRT